MEDRIRAAETSEDTLFYSPLHVFHHAPPASVVSRQMKTRNKGMDVILHVGCSNRNVHHHRKEDLILPEGCSVSLSLSLFHALLLLDYNLFIHY